MSQTTQRTRREIESLLADARSERQDVAIRARVDPVARRRLEELKVAVDKLQAELDDLNDEERS